MRDNVFWLYLGIDCSRFYTELDGNEAFDMILFYSVSYTRWILLSGDQQDTAKLDFLQGYAMARHDPLPEE